MNTRSECQSISLRIIEKWLHTFQLNLTETLHEKKFDSSAGANTSYVILKTCLIPKPVKKYLKLSLVARVYCIVGAR